MKFYRVIFSFCNSWKEIESYTTKFKKIVVAEDEEDVKKIIMSEYNDTINIFGIVFFKIEEIKIERGITNF